MTWVVLAGLVGAWLAWMAYVASGRASDLAQQAALARIDGAQAVAAKAQLETEETRLETAIIQRLMRPRHIPMSVDDPVVRAKYAALSEFTGKRVVFFVVPTPEAQQLSAELWTVLKAAGWNPGKTREVLGLPSVIVYSGFPSNTPDWRAGKAVADLVNAVFEMNGVGGLPIRNMPETLLPSTVPYDRLPGTMAITVGMPDVELQLLEIRARELLAAPSKKEK